jgi:hypothetical protein
MSIVVSVARFLWRVAGALHTDIRKSKSQATGTGQHATEIKKAYIEKSGVQLTFAYLSRGCLAGRVECSTL